MADELVSSIRKNATEEIRVALTEYNGYQLVNIRVFFDAGEGEMRPGKAGIAFRVEKLPEFADAISAALERARTRRLCK